jgi:CRP-like cAMP-binding protein
MTELQRNEFTSRMTERIYKKGQFAWGKNLQPNTCFLLMKGEMVMLGSSNLGVISISPG